MTAYVLIPVWTDMLTISPQLAVVQICPALRHPFQPRDLERRPISHPGPVGQSRKDVAPVVGVEVGVVVVPAVLHRVSHRPLPIVGTQVLELLRESSRAVLVLGRRRQQLRLGLLVLPV